jgi:hypothetical protein
MRLISRRLASVQSSWRIKKPAPMGEFAVLNRLAVLSIITGGGKWVELTIPADSLYQHLLLTAEKKFWRCVETGEPPRLFLADPPRVRIEAVHIVVEAANTPANDQNLA